MRMMSLVIVVFVIMLVTTVSAIPTVELNKTINQTKTATNMPIVILNNPENMSMLNVNNSQYLQGYTPTTLGTFLQGLMGWLTKAVADTYYADIKWDYNQTYTLGTFNSTYNTWAYNQTSTITNSSLNLSYVPYNFTQNINGSGNFQTTGNVSVKSDSSKSYWGADNDLDIYHSGTHGYIENNVGTLYILSNPVSFLAPAVKIDTSTATKTASSTWSTNVAANAFDGSITQANSWLSNGNAPQWLKIQFTSGQVINKYRYYYGDSIDESGNFEGSNDGTTWTILKTFSYPDTDTWYEETFTNTNSYIYYRFNITTCGTWVRINEIELYAGATNVVVSGTLTSDTITDGVCSISRGNLATTQNITARDINITNKLYFGSLGNYIYGNSASLNFITNATNSSGIAWFSNNISATGYITRTSVYDKSKGSALDKIKDADDYLDNGEINHNAFYGFVQYEVIDYSKPVIIKIPKKECYDDCKEVCSELNKSDCITTCDVICIDVYHDETIYPYTKLESGVDLGKEIDVLRQALWEIKLETCAKDKNKWSWCNADGSVK